MDEIIDPVSNRRYNIHSSSAREILRNYIINYKTGGSTLPPLPPVEEPWYAKYFSPLLEILPLAQYPDKEYIHRLSTIIAAKHDNKINIIIGLIQRASMNSIERDLLIIRLGRIRQQQILFSAVFNGYLKHMSQRGLVNASDFRTTLYPEIFKYFRNVHRRFSYELNYDYIRLFHFLKNIPVYVLSYPVVSIPREIGVLPHNHHMIDYLESGFEADGWITNLMQTIDEDSEMEEDSDPDEPDLPPLRQSISYINELN